MARLADDLDTIRADAGQMQQVIVNLAVNARDAMPLGGTLLIETANVVFDAEYAQRHPETKAGPHVMLAVTDTGTGISEEVRGRMFEPFFTTKPKGRGTGLGLSTVYGMVKQSGGWIWVYSEPEQGTTFKIYFPRSGEAATVAAPVLAADTHGKETILVVEDQDDVRHLTLMALSKFGYTVHCAAQGEEAIAFSRQFEGTIDLLLTDVIMPGMNGRQVAERLAIERPAMRILYMSGYSADAIAHRGVLEPGLDYIQKPFSAESLAAKVRKMLGPPAADSHA